MYISYENGQMVHFFFSPRSCVSNSTERLLGPLNAAQGIDERRLTSLVTLVMSLSNDAMLSGV